ncbi:hypothetical protein [Kordiimonas aquimaris]|uniref:hypothetical protein n=1 Tax=Kordiimonas aquimaris TaxID=707591 RepID=UPI0021CE9667|nr:hypothetical protein [Kordiimonas aquimaris]
MKIITTVVLALAVSSASLAQNGTVAQSHRPNDYTLACLEALTRDCAFSAALQTVIAEEFGVERAKVLIAVARALSETGQQGQAIETLMLALDEARSVNLNLVTQEKITEIAPLLARAGDSASALALTEELEIKSVKERTLIAIARENMLAGRVADANVALSQMENGSRASWQRLRMLPFAPASAIAALNLIELDQQIREYTLPSQLYRGLILMAVVADKRGDTETRQAYINEADEFFASLVSINDRALSTAHRLRIMHDGGLNEAMLTESYNLALLHLGRVRGAETLESVALLIGEVEASLGNLESALARQEVFTDLANKARYLSSIVMSSERALIAEQTSAVMAEVSELEGVYERDLIRLQLLEGALGNKDIVLAANIIRSIEDDDNQARGLVLAASLLE